MGGTAGNESCFFFSSRRRHTRSLRDWSSDVCSSDLVGVEVPGRVPHVGVAPRQHEHLLPLADQELDQAARSEERRVGKECRYGWAACQYEKNSQSAWADGVIDGYTW